MQEITEKLFKQEFEKSKNNLTDIEAGFWLQGRSFIVDNKPKFSYDAFQVDTNQFEWLEVRTYQDGSQKFFGSR